MTGEGVIKFDLHFAPASPLPGDAIVGLVAWRRILYDLHLIGRDPERYDGLGFGNISGRLPPWEADPEQRRFAITGTQTGGLTGLGAEHFAVVNECRPAANRVDAVGPVRPSAEALTHGAIYAADPGLRCVMHAHSPSIWSRAKSLGLPVTRESAAYGSPEIADEVKRLLARPEGGLGVFAMGGHQDGVFAFGCTPEEAGGRLLQILARSYELDVLC